MARKAIWSDEAIADLAAAVREIIFDPYRIIYEVNADGQTVDILRVWHAARGRPEV